MVSVKVCLVALVAVFACLLMPNSAQVTTVDTYPEALTCSACGTVGEPRRDTVDACLHALKNWFRLYFNEEQATVCAVQIFWLISVIIQEAYPALTDLGLIVTAIVTVLRYIVSHVVLGPVLATVSQTLLTVLVCLGLVWTF